MLLADRLRALRKAKKLTQGEIEKLSGLKPSYISRAENGHVTPAVETLEKWARALEVPLYQLFYEGQRPPKLPPLAKRKAAEKITFGSSMKEARTLAQFRRLFAHIEKRDRQLLLNVAQKMARH